jgi:putative resolvase
MTEQLTLSKASKIIGVTTKTLRNWDDAGKIKTTRTSGNHRRISMDEIRRLQGITQSSTQIKTLAYCRCSTLKQKDNLDRQVGRVLEHCYTNKWDVELYKDIGSGLNENRREFKKLLKRVADNDVARVVVEYKDRIARYGFETFVVMCKNFNVEVIVLEEKEEQSFEEEMVDDIISLITSYSARIYGKRGGKKKNA